jgi:hypothetical protein
MVKEHLAYLTLNTTYSPCETEAERTIAIMWTNTQWGVKGLWNPFQVDSFQIHVCVLENVPCSQEFRTRQVLYSLGTCQFLSWFLRIIRYGLHCIMSLLQFNLEHHWRSGPTMTIVVFGIAAKADAMTNHIIWLITSRQSSWRIMSIAPDRESRERLCSYPLTHHPHQMK